MLILFLKEYFECYQGKYYIRISYCNYNNNVIIFKEQVFMPSTQLRVLIYYILIIQQDNSIKTKAQNDYILVVFQLIGELVFKFKIDWHQRFGS